MSVISRSLVFASPHITVDDWVAGRYNDVDVFEDQIRTWLFDQADALTSRDHSGPAILALITPYFESVECYHTGKSSKNNETPFLKRGILRVVPHLSTETVDLFATEVRHGFAHEAIFRKVAIHRGHPGCPEFAVVKGLLYIDPWWLLARTRQHFNEYVASLKNPDFQDRLIAFQKFMAIRKSR